jgi:hypothetical protein
MSKLLTIILSTLFVFTLGQASAATPYSGASSLDQFSQPTFCGSHSEGKDMDKMKKKKKGEEEEPECE